MISKVIFAAFLLLFISNNSFAQKNPAQTEKTVSCSIDQPVVSNNSGFPSDFYGAYQSADDFFVPANENWYIQNASVYFYTNNDINVSDFILTIYKEELGELVYYTSADFLQGDFSFTLLGNYSIGNLYKVTFDLMTTPYVDQLEGGSSGTNYWISVVSVNGDIANPFVWEASALTASPYGMNALSSPDNGINWYTTNSDLSFELNYAKSRVENVTACLPFTWIDGNTYDNTYETANFLIPGAAPNGCDSVIKLKLIGLISPTSIDSQLVCDQLTWIDGNTYTNSNNMAQFIYSGGAVNGCDSTVTLNLIVDDFVAEIIDNGDGTFSATNGVSFQWINCTTNQVYVEDTADIFTPTTGGSYAVISTSAFGCSDTSNCIAVDDAGIAENNLLQVNLYPNPSSNSVQVFFIGESANLVLLDEAGKTILSKTIQSGEELMIADLAKSVYFVQLTTSKGSAISRLVKL